MTSKNKILSDLGKNFGYILVWLAAIGVWQIASINNLLNKAFIPSPFSILKEFVRPELYSIFFTDAIYTISRLIVGIFAGYLIVLILMFLSFQSDFFKNFINQVNSILKFVPPPVLIPLAILGVGINNGTVIVVVLITSVFLILDYAFAIHQKEVSGYKGIFESWHLSRNLQYRDFFLPISHFLSYRLVSTLVIWSLSVTIFSEIVTGVSQGFGPRLIQLQQVYQSNTLFALIIGIILFSYGCERVLVYAYARYRFDLAKTIAVSVLSSIVIAGIVFQGYLFFINYQSQSNKLIISTYNATLNLPLFVYAEKFNSLNMSLQVTSSGIQTVDNILADKVAVGGYADIPNALSGISQNNELKILSQAEEQPKNPILYLISSKNISKNSYQELSNSKIGYYPNNPIIRTGLDLTLTLGGATSGSNEFVSGNDPTVLAQSFVSNQLDAILTIEPYVTQIEKETNQIRINKDQSLINGISFKFLPLTALLINPNKFTEEELGEFVDGLYKSIQYIQQNSTSGKANSELSAIMEKYNIDSSSIIPYFSYGDNLDPKNLSLVIALIKQYDTQIGQQIGNPDIDSWYY